MQFSAGQIAEFLQGEVDGDAQVLVYDIAKIEEGRLGTLTFLANPVYTEHLYTTAASVAIVERSFKPTRPIAKSLTLIRVSDPRAAFAKLLEMHDAHQYEKIGYEQPSYISPKAKLGKDVYVGAFSYIGDGAVLEDGVKVFPNCFIGDNVRIGKGTRLHAGVKVHAKCTIGERCMLHSGVVIGADGYGFTTNAKGEQEKMAQIGNVVIEDDVEIGANTTVDRATLGSTFIRKGAKLDNLIQVGHNAEIGEHTLVVSQTGIAGSSRIGKYCMIGGQVGIAGHLTIGDRVKIAAQSGIASNIPDDSVVQGSPAFTIGEYKRSYVHFRNFPEMKKRIDQLEKELVELKALQSEADPLVNERMSDKQHTLKAKATVEGVGLHTGEPVTLTLCPAPVGHGYKFQRTDLEGQPIIDADADLVVSTARGTTLGKGDVRVNTTEHVLAAVYALGIDNCLIQISGPEVPIMDGSALPFVKAIQEVGLEEQNAARNWWVLKEPIWFETSERGTEMLGVPAPGGEFRLTVMVDYNSPVLGTQHASMYNTGEFMAEIAPCRTFVFLRELEQLAGAGLIKGGDLDNAIVLEDREGITKDDLKALAKVLGREYKDVEIRRNGVLNTTDLKFLNEPARHKLLDIIGDLALVGRPIKGHILAARPGHMGNTSFAKRIKEKMREEEKNPLMHFDLTKEPLFDINAITKMLPHRYPFLLVDKVMSMDATSIVGVKNVTMNEPQFTGHFPDNPVMPGVLQVEAMAQVGGIFALSQVPDPENYTTYFLKTDGVRYRRKVIPGDTLVFRLELLTPIRRGIVHMKGIGYVNGQPAVEAEMMAQIARDKAPAAEKPKAAEPATPKPSTVKA